MIVLLDAGPLGMATSPHTSTQGRQSRLWLRTLAVSNVRVLVPEIADYEVRRELLRAGRTLGVSRLDRLKAVTGYLPITTETMLQAATFWAQARQRGRPTAPDLALDGDVILAAQAFILSQQGDPVVIATTNVAHLSRFVPAQRWQDISAPTP